MKELFPHQQEAVTKVREAFKSGYKKICLQAPTGMGKTVIATHIIQGALAKGNKVLFLVHLKELIEQTAKAQTEAGLQYGYISAEYPFTKNKQLYLASTQTLGRRLTKLNIPFDLIIYDECHHSMAKTNLEILEHYKNTPMIGLTATPERLDGKGLDAIFDKLVTSISVAELIKLGYLCKFDYYAPKSGINFEAVHTLAGDYNPKELGEEIDKTTIFGKAVEHYKKYIDGEPAICFCLNIKHSIKVTNEFKAAGIPAAHIDSKIPKSERAKIVNSFRRGEIKVLSNVNLITEGFDVPACKGIFLLRPTKSLTLFLQMVGRGLRRNWNVTPEEDLCCIFDHVENWKEHGSPDDEREWDLAGRPPKDKVNKQKSDKKYINCTSCSHLYDLKKVKQCPKCGNQEIFETTEIQHTDGQLEKITDFYKPGKQIKKNIFTKEQIKEMKRRCRTIDDYRTLAKKLNYKNGWAEMQLQLRNKWKKRYSN